MWRRTYLLLLLVRIYFALSPSYLHPDENFQGPEVIAGVCFGGRENHRLIPCQERYSPIPYKRPGNGRRRTQSEVSSLCGQPTVSL